MRTWLFILVLLFCLLFASFSFANENNITIGYAPFCEHIFSDKARYNEHNNHAVFIGYDNWWVMTFRNSNYDRSFAAGYVFKTKKKELYEALYVRGNLLVGVVSGYKHRTIKFGGVSPAVAPTLELGYGRYAVHGAFLGAAVTMMFTITFY